MGSFLLVRKVSEDLMTKSCRWKIKGVKATGLTSQCFGVKSCRVFEVTGDPADVIATYIDNKEVWLEHFVVMSEGAVKQIALDESVIVKMPLSPQDELMLGSIKENVTRVAGRAATMSRINFWLSCLPCITRPLLARQRVDVVPITLIDDVQHIRLTQTANSNIVVDNDRTYIEIDLVDPEHKERAQMADTLRNIKQVPQAW